MASKGRDSLGNHLDLVNRMVSRWGSMGDGELDGICDELGTDSDYDDNKKNEDENIIPQIPKLCVFQEIEMVNEDKTRFSMLFDKIDPDDNGDVDEKEWISGIKRLASNIQHKDITLAFKLMDGDKSGYIDRQDWISFCMTSYTSNELKRLQNCVLKQIETINCFVECVDCKIMGMCHNKRCIDCDVKVKAKAAKQERTILFSSIKHTLDQIFIDGIIEIIFNYSIGYVLNCGNYNQCDNEIHLNNLSDIQTNKDVNGNKFYFYYVEENHRQSLCINDNKYIVIFCSECTNNNNIRCCQCGQLCFSDSNDDGACSGFHCYACKYQL